MISVVVLIPVDSEGKPMQELVVRSILKNSIGWSNEAICPVSESGRSSESGKKRLRAR